MRPLTDSIPEPLSNERGIALITALLITLLLTLVVVALSYRVGLFSIGTRDHVVKSQSLYTAEIGLNQARYFLMAGDCIPPNFKACNGLGAINSSTFVNMSSSLKSVFSSAMPQFTVAGETFNYDLTGSMTHGSSDQYNYKVYIKQTNVPKVVNIMAVATRPGTEQAQTVIDAGLIFTKQGNDYKQFGQGGSREGLTNETVGVGTDTSNLRTPF